MSEHNETLADIVAEMRGMGNYQRYSGDHAHALADRIEAAAKRERGEIEANALAVGGVVEASRNKPSGDSAAMREALELMNNLFDKGVICTSYANTPEEMANMKVVGNCEYGLILYRDKLPKFNNHGRMIFNCFDWQQDCGDVPKCHPTQKPVRLLKQLIEIFTDRGDVVIDPCAGSGSTLRAAAELGRRAFGFEIKKEFFNAAKEKMLAVFQPTLAFCDDEKGA